MRFALAKRVPPRQKRSTSLKRCPANIRDLFASKQELERCTDLIASIVPRMIEEEVPGFIKPRGRRAKNKCKINKLYKRLTDAALTRCRAVLTWVLELHREGKSLNGRFKYADLRFSSRNSVKCRSSRLLYLEESNASNTAADMGSVKQVILQIVGVDQPSEVPTDLQKLLSVLSNYKIGDELLIENHPGLQGESKKLQLFNPLFAQLEFLEMTDEQVSECDREIIREQWMEEEN